MTAPEVCGCEHSKRLAAVIRTTAGNIGRALDLLADQRIPLDEKQALVEQVRSMLRHMEALP